MMVMKDKNDCKGSWDLASGFVYVLIYFFALFFFFSRRCSVLYQGSNISVFKTKYRKPCLMLEEERYI